MRRVMRGVASVAMALGAVLLARDAFLVVKAWVARGLIARAWEVRVEEGRAEPPWAWADTVPVARLRIPALGYDEVVLEGANLRAMAFGPTRMEHASRPGEPGNIVLAGHRNNWFAVLEHVAAGQHVELLWPAGRSGVLARRYVVASVDIITPEDTRFIQATEDDVLTLITCYPFTASPVSPYRYVVRARPVA